MNYLRAQVNFRQLRAETAGNRYLRRFLPASAGIFTCGSVYLRPLQVILHAPVLQCIFSCIENLMNRNCSKVQLVKKFCRYSNSFSAEFLPARSRTTPTQKLVLFNLHDIIGLFSNNHYCAPVHGKCCRPTSTSPSFSFVGKKFCLCKARHGDITIPQYVLQENAKGIKVLGCIQN